MAAENKPLQYAISIETSVKALEEALPDNKVRDTEDSIADISSHLDELEKYLTRELRLTLVTDNYLIKNRELLSDYTTKLNAIITAARKLSKIIVPLSKMNIIDSQYNTFGAIEMALSTIKDDVEALKKATDGFVRIKTRKNINGNVATTIFTNNPEKSTGEVVIKVNERYFKKPVSPTTLDPRAEKSFKGSLSKMQKIQQQQNTNGGRRSRHRRTRRNWKTRRVTKHSRRGTRRV
jgi:hypothetical protein